jgi:P pilus assembly chaperone PapD
MSKFNSPSIYMNQSATIINVKKEAIKEVINMPITNAIKRAVVIVLALAMPVLALAQTGNWTGTVSSVNGTAIVLKTSNGTNYAVDMTNAKLTRRSGSAVTQISYVQPGDQIQVQGTMSGTNIAATTIQDKSLVGGATFTATVKSVSDPNFMLQIVNTGPLTVATDSSTTITSNGQPAQFSSIMVGKKVTVKGVWDTANKTMTASSVNIM